MGAGKMTVTTGSRQRRIPILWMAGAGGAVIALPWFVSSTYGLVLLNMALIHSLLVLGFNFIYGLTGILSLAQAALWGIGAYTSAILTTEKGLSFWLALPAAGILAGLAAFLLGVFTLKLKSHYLTMVTIGFSEIVRLVLLNYEELTHGAFGIRNIPPPALGPLTLQNPRLFYYLALFFVLLALLFTGRFRDSRLGLALQALRDDELAAAAVGVDVAYGKILAFTLSGLLSGVAGSLFAHFATYISPDLFSLEATIRFLSMLLIGGVGTLAGPVIGAFFLTYLPEWLRFLQDYYMAVYGLGILLVLIFLPQGIAGFLGRGLRWTGEGGKSYGSS